MSYLISYYLIIANFFSKKKYKIRNIVLFLFLWILAGWNTFNADFSNYEVRYNINYYSGLEVGYQILCQIFYKLGFSYQGMRITLYFICLAILFHTIKKYTRDPNFAIICYFIFPFFLDVVQTRNMIVSVILVYSLKYLIKDGWKNTLKFIICILLAGSFHVAGYYYLLFLIAKIIKKKKTYLLFCVFSTFFGIIAVYSGFLEKILFILIKRKRTLQYLNNKNGLSMLFFILLITLIIGTFYYFYWQYIRCNKSRILDKNMLAFSDLLYKLNATILPVLILMIFNSLFFRIIRNFMIVNYIFLSAVTDRGGRNTNKNISERILIIFVLLFVAITQYMGNYNETIKAILENNILF